MQSSTLNTFNMKKVILAIAIIAMIGGFASCSKVKTCHCKDTVTNIWQPSFEIEEGNCSDYNTTVGGTTLVECVKQ